MMSVVAEFGRTCRAGLMSGVAEFGRSCRTVMMSDEVVWWRSGPPAPGPRLVPVGVPLNLSLPVLVSGVFIHLVTT